MSAFAVGVFVYGLACRIGCSRGCSNGYIQQSHSRLLRRALAKNLLYCFIGVFVGTMIGVLPGIGPLATIAMLLPITFNLRADVGAHHARGHLLRCAVWRLDDGHSGEAARRDPLSVVTCLDGHEMARQGRAGPALAIAAIASFIAGNVGTILIAQFGPRSPKSRSSSVRPNTSR